MGLLTQLIADHHDTETKKQATQVSLWKSILEDKRTPEDGGFTSDMKNHALEQMVGMAQGGKGGKGGGGGAGGGGGKGKAGEMLGVFQKLLGLHPGGNGQPVDQQQPMQQAAAKVQAGGGGGGGGNTDDPGSPEPAPQAPPTQQPQQRQAGARQPLQRPIQPPVQAPPSPTQQQTGQLKAFLSPKEIDARTADLAKQKTQQTIDNDVAVGTAKGKFDRGQAELEAQMKVDGVKALMAKGVSKEEAEAIYGVKEQVPAHKVGAPSFEVRDGKNVKVTSLSDGTETVEPDIQKQPTAGAGGGLTGNAKNIKWAHDHENSADPTEAITAKQILNEAENKKFSSDIQFKMKSMQYENLKNSTSPDAINTLAQGVKDGLGDPNLTNMPRTTAALVTAKLDKDKFNLAAAKQEYNAVKTAFAALNSPQQTRIRQNVEQAKESLPLLTDAGQAWADSLKASGKNPLLNSAELGLAKQGIYGDKAQSAAVVFEGQIADIQAELSSIYMGSASPTDKAIELAQKSLKSNWNWSTLQAQLAQVDKNLDRRESAISHLVVMGAGQDSSYIPKDASGNVQTTDQNADSNKQKVTPPWMIQAQTKPTGSIISLPNGKKVKKTGDNEFTPIPDAPGRGGK